MGFPLVPRGHRLRSSLSWDRLATWSVSLPNDIKKATNDGYAIGDEAHLHSLQASVLRLEYSITEMTAVQTTLVDRFNHYIQNTDHSPGASARAKDQLVAVSERVKAVIWCCQSIRTRT